MGQTQHNENTEITDVKQIITAYGNTWLLLEDGSVWATGRNDEGQVGNGTTTDQLWLTKVSMPAAAGPIRLIASQSSMQLTQVRQWCFNRVRRCLSLGLQQLRAMRKFCWNKPKHSSKTQWSIKHRLISRWCWRCLWNVGGY